MNFLNNIPKGFCFQVLPIFFVGSVAILTLILGIVPLYFLFFTFVSWILISGLGIAVGYHRVFSHKTHNLPRWKENIILFFAALAGQGSSIFWVAVHRGYHHPYADTERDIHSPVVYGKYKAFIGWHSNITDNNNVVNMKYSVDLLRKSNHVWFHNHQIKILWFVPLIVALFSWKFALVGICLASFIGLLQDNLVNIYGHIKGKIGYRNFDTLDSSYNNLILGYLGWGQGWHNNHHAYPRNFDFGSGTSGKWWELDPCRIFKVFL